MAALVLARMHPAHFLAEERRSIEGRKRVVITIVVIKRQELTVTLREWQELWIRHDENGVDAKVDSGYPEVAELANAR